MKFTEAQLESSIIKLPREKRYLHVLKETVGDQPQVMLIKAELHTLLLKLIFEEPRRPQLELLAEEGAL
jgi:hypothetical protein